MGMDVQCLHLVCSSCMAEVPHVVHVACTCTPLPHPSSPYSPQQPLPSNPSQVHVMDKLHGEHLHSERACLEQHYTGQLQAVQLVSVAERTDLAGGCGAPRVTGVAA